MCSQHAARQREPGDLPPAASRSRGYLSRFLLKGLADGLPHDLFNFLAKSGSQALGVLQNQLSNHLPQTPLKQQVNPPQDPLRHLFLQLDRKRHGHFGLF